MEIKDCTVHSWLSEPLWSGGCSDKWNYHKRKYQQHHYILSVLLALALA